MNRATTNWSDESADVGRVDRVVGTIPPNCPSRKETGGARKMPRVNNPQKFLVSPLYARFLPID
jgi:hypothetical protein